MTWRWWRCRPALEKAAEARELSQAELAQARERSREADSVIDRLRAHRDKNHFAELFGKAFGSR